MATTPDQRLRAIMAPAMKRLFAFVPDVPAIRFDMQLSRESAAGGTSGRVGAGPSAIPRQLSRQLSRNQRAQSAAPAEGGS
jgi:hypothetical protein